MSSLVDLKSVVENPNTHAHSDKQCLDSADQVFSFDVASKTLNCIFLSLMPLLKLIFYSLILRVLRLSFIKGVSTANLVFLISISST
jgi:hypothetical protein